MENSEIYTQAISLSTAANLYDLSMLEEMDDTEYLLEVLTIFLRDTGLELKEMTAALNAGDTVIIAKKAHKIKGSAGIIQAGELCNLLDRIEKIAKTGTVDDTIKNLVENTLSLYNMIEQTLKKHIPELK